MNGELLRIVDSIHRDKNIPKDIVFEGIEAALLSAARKHYNETDDLLVSIDRESGNIAAKRNDEPIDTEEFGRIAAQTAKQVIIQKIREAERDALFLEFDDLRGHIVTGTVQRFEGRSATVNLGKTEGILPRSEQIPGESHHPGERVRAIVLDVRKAGSRVKIILSRTHPEFVRRLFEIEVPEIAEHVIEIKALSREAGYRSKVAVASIDQQVDCVGACVGVRGTRIKNIVEELAGERIDIVRWNESLQVLIPNALQPAEVEDVILCPMIGRAIVLVAEDQLSLAIGRRGQNVRLASKLSGWDIEIMTPDELNEQIDRAEAGFANVPGMSSELGERLVAEGFLSYDDLSVIEPTDLIEMGGITQEQADGMIAFAEQQAEIMEAEARERARQAAVQEAARAEAEAAAAEEGTLEETSEGGEGAADLVAEEEGAETAVGEAAAAEEGTLEETSEGGEGAADLVAEEEGAETAVAEAGPAEGDATEEAGVESLMPQETPDGEPAEPVLEDLDVAEDNLEGSAPSEQDVAEAARTEQESK
jgi:N utilization substance protein A